MLRLENYLLISDEVSEAITFGKPVVALESTIISHGMPFPTNFETAMMLEDEVREVGAVPATIAIMEGKIKVGLTRNEIEALASSQDVHKVSRRDIPYILAMGKNGATTVATTMIFASLAGIKVFATGGIGGVHRGGEKSFDISSDLYELANTNVAVVCAGVKSILDIGLTLEKLESFGVPVIGFGTNKFPAFYTIESGFDVDYRVDRVDDIAKILSIKWAAGLNGGIVIANPVPKEFEANPYKINMAIQEALDQAANTGVKGKEVTPFLLRTVKELTDGESLKSNISLVKNNANLAAQIAIELCNIDLKPQSEKERIYGM